MSVASPPFHKGCSGRSTEHVLAGRQFLLFTTLRDRYDNNVPAHDAIRDYVVKCSGCTNADNIILEGSSSGSMCGSTWGFSPKDWELSDQSSVFTCLRADGSDIPHVARIMKRQNEVDVQQAASQNLSIQVLPVQCQGDDELILCEEGKSASTCALNSRCSCASGRGRFGDICIDCAKGKYSATVAGEKSCLQCPVGRYGSTTGLDQCALCPPGQMQQNATTVRDKCKKCKPGQFVGQRSENNSATECKDCESGKYARASGSANCTACPAGQYQETAGKKSCKYCSVGQYSAATGGTKCQACPPNTVGDPPGSSTTGSQTCYCKQGFYFDSTHSSTDSLLQVGCTACAEVVPHASLVCEGGKDGSKAVAAADHFVIAIPCVIGGTNHTCVTSYLCSGDSVCLGPLTATTNSSGNRRSLASASASPVLIEYGGVQNQCRPGHHGLYCATCDSGLEVRG